MADFKYWTITRFDGGLANSQKIGIEGSFYNGYGLDYRTDHAGITANYALEKDSSTNVTDLIKWIKVDAVNDNVYAYGDSGELYQESGGTWSSERSVGASTGQGLGIYDDYLYYRQNAQIGRYGALSGGAGFTDGWKAGGDGVETISDWGPIHTFLNFIAFGNGRYLATWDGTTFTSQDLTFPPDHYVRDLARSGDYLAIAVNDEDAIADASKGYLFFWDGISSAFNKYVEAPEGQINSLVSDGTTLYLNIGEVGNWYTYSEPLEKIAKTPLVGSAKKVYSYPDASDTFRGMMHFGLASGTSTTVNRGVYSLGRISPNFDMTINFDYPISTGTRTGTTLDIGAVHGRGNELYVGWDDNGTYGIDKLSTSTLQTEVEYESLLFDGETPYLEKTLHRMKLTFETLASGEEIEVYYKADRDSYNLIDTISYTDDGAVAQSILNISPGVNFYELQIKIVLKGSSTMPTAISLTTEYEEGDEIIA